MRPPIMQPSMPRLPEGRSATSRTRRTSGRCCGLLTLSWRVRNESRDFLGALCARLSVPFATESFQWLAREALHKLHQAPQSNSRGPFRDPRFLLFHPGRSGDVEMDPRSIFRKLLQEHGGVNGAAPAPPGVDHVRAFLANVLLVFVIKRKAPHLFPGFRLRF